MANRKNTFLLKRSNVPGKIPPLSGLTTGEVALNTADAKMYTIYTSGDTLPQEVRQIGWDRVNRTGDTVTGNFTFNGDVTITSGFTFTNGAQDGYVLTSDAFGNSTWQVGGPTLRNVTATTTFATPNETVNCTGNTFTVNLPTAVGIQGTTYTLVNSGTGVITLQPNGLETINGSLSIDLSIQYISRTVQSDGSNWIII
jgi:hypothetical protein